MKVIGRDDLANAPDLKVEDSAIVDASLSTILPKLDNPVELQKEITAQVYLSLQKRIREEMNKNGFLSDSTRQWINQFNSMCDSLQKNMFGDKSIQFNINKISHSDINALIQSVAEKRGKPSTTQIKAIDAEFIEKVTDKPQ